MKQTRLLLFFAFAFAWLGAATQAEVPESKYGADDTLGAINNLSREKVLQATIRRLRGGRMELSGKSLSLKSPYPSITFFAFCSRANILMG